MLKGNAKKKDIFDYEKILRNENNNNDQHLAWEVESILTLQPYT